MVWVHECTMIYAMLGSILHIQLLVWVSQGPCLASMLEAGIVYGAWLCKVFSLHSHRTERKGKKRKEEKRKDYTFRRQFNEKSSIMLAARFYGNTSDSPSLHSSSCCLQVLCNHSQLLG